MAIALCAALAAAQTRPATNPAAPWLAMALDELTRAKPYEESPLPLILAVELAADRAVRLLAEALRGRHANGFANAWVGLTAAYAAANQFTGAIQTAAALPDPLDHLRMV